MPESKIWFSLALLNEGFPPKTLSRWILKWANHSIFFKAMSSLFWLAIYLGFWLWRTNLSLTKDGNILFGEREPDVISLNMNMKSQSRSQKPPYVSAWGWLSTRRAKLITGSEMPNWEHWIVPMQQGVENNWKALWRSHPFVWRNFVRWCSFMWWSFAQPNIVVFVGE